MFNVCLMEHYSCMFGSRIVCRVELLFARLAVVRLLLLGDHHQRVDFDCNVTEQS